MMKRDKLVEAVQQLISRCIVLEEACKSVEKVSASEDIAVARAFLVTARRRLEGPMPWERPS